ncbi:hypothetical protein H257_03509 [Aphanomyces astaci]|uniref:Cyclic nucleotide-binding domain-containing protein n=1 Tax=Aphanomyces astaci TaxID=112090 RepID=W4GX08_APHAT|nr:hypothetical protein H257_03509 [Aphanomyces astaci]ETV84250.1 hypothetical protein H257_03509 [Aphanomyces astaci]|eukprot:XP_009825942.1 hypothetical protein H257_03509 [Aphanomyces astaci]
MLNELKKQTSKPKLTNPPQDLASPSVPPVLDDTNGQLISSRAAKYQVEEGGLIPKSSARHPLHDSNKIVPVRERLHRNSAGATDDANDMRMRKNKEFFQSKRVHKSTNGRPTKSNLYKRQAYLHPNSQFRAGWDLFMIVLLVYTSLLTPYEIAFVETVTVDGLFMVDRSVDLSFLMDMGFNFMTPFVDKENNQLIEDMGQIAQKYLTGWFILDFVSIIPFDVISMTFKGDSGGPEISAKKDLTSHLKIIRIIRLFRLIKLVRVLRASRIYSRWEAILGFKYTSVKLAKFLSCVLILAHWLACLWGLTPALEDVGPDEHSWMDAYHVDQSSALEKYVVSLYWSVMTIGTVGYGDVQPKTDFERCICIGCMLCGGGTYAYIIGAVCGLVASMDEAETEFNQQMDHLNVYMNKEKVPRDMKVKLREYFLHSRDLLQHKYFSHVIATLSPGLRGLISVYTNGEWANNIYFFNGGPYDEHVRFVTAITQQLKAELYPPNENIVDLGDPTDKMYIISKGIVARMGRVMGKGRFFGEDVILSHGIRKYTVRTLTYVDAYSLSRTDLESVLSHGMFPFKTKQIRVAASFLALKRLLQSLMLELRLLRRDTASKGFTSVHETTWMRRKLLGDPLATHNQVQFQLHLAMERLTTAVKHCDDSMEDAAQARLASSTDGSILLSAAHKRTDSIATSKQLLLQAIAMLQKLSDTRVPPLSA